MTNASVESLDTTGNGVKAKVKTAKGEETLEADIVLSAVGIAANIEGQGFEEVGIKTEKGRVLVNEWYETSVPGYYAIGDIIPTQALAHVASAEGITCVEKIKGLHVQPINYGNIPGCTYCHPEIASVGLTEKQAKEKRTLKDQSELFGSYCELFTQITWYNNQDRRNYDCANHHNL